MPHNSQLLTSITHRVQGKAQIAHVCVKFNIVMPKESKRNKI